MFRVCVEDWSPLPAEFLHVFEGKTRLVKLAGRVLACGSGVNAGAREMGDRGDNGAVDESPEVEGDSQVCGGSWVR